jgi:hypothetical protein
VKDTHRLIDDWALRVFAVEETRGVFGTTDEWVRGIYHMLTDEQKIAFILTGGVPSLLQCQRYSVEQTGAGSDTETGSLPVLCY